METTRIHVLAFEELYKIKSLFVEIYQAIQEFEGIYCIWIST